MHRRVYFHHITCCSKYAQHLHICNALALASACGKSVLAVCMQYLSIYCICVTWMFCFLSQLRMLPLSARSFAQRLTTPSPFTGHQKMSSAWFHTSCSTPSPPARLTSSVSERAKLAPDDICKIQTDHIHAYWRNICVIFSPNIIYLILFQLIIFIFLLFLFKLINSIHFLIVLVCFFSSCLVTLTSY